MNIIAADDEQLALESLVEAIEEASPDAKIYSFKKASEVLKFAESTLCEIAFLDIEMRGMTGIDLAKALKDINPKINIIFVTGYSEFMKDAFSLHASGYVLKPPTREAIEKELKELRNPVTVDTERIVACTFGNFDIFVNGEPITFRRSKAKEILAYLVDRKGATVTISEIASIVFEDKEYNRSLQKQIQVYISDMLSALKKVNAQNIIIKKHNSISVNKDNFKCDYYDFLNMNPSAINSYHGEYMNNYSWAEFTTAWINQRIKI